MLNITSNQIESTYIQFNRQLLTLSEHEDGVEKSRYNVPSTSWQIMELASLFGEASA
jgi:hypothetical protein